MVCDRCLMSVRSILDNLKLEYNNLSLGRLEFQKPLSIKEFDALEKELKKMGFEIVAERNARIVNTIKTKIIQLVYEKKDFHNKKLSEVLSNALHYDYSYLTGIFTKTEGHSIQSYNNKVKAERIRELLEYNELNISEIAHKMAFGSAAYLSTFFKKETGLSPSQYKLQHSERKSLNDI